VVVSLVGDNVLKEKVRSAKAVTEEIVTEEEQHKIVGK
jgi:hypothetical protein